MTPPPSVPSTGVPKPFFVQPRIIANLRWRNTGTGPEWRAFPAASGLVLVGDFLSVCADDELDLALFQRTDGAFVRRTSLIPGELPMDEKPRKKVKPDFEVLVAVSQIGKSEEVQLLAVGSGSRETRDRAVLVRLAAQDGAPLGAPEIFSLKPLYDRFRAGTSGLNIEGLTVLDRRKLCFVHRSTALARGPSRFFVVQLAADLPMGLHAAHIDAATVSAEIPLALPVVDGIPAGPTDSLELANGDILLSWAAERTEDPVLDGEIVGCGLAIAPRTTLDSARAGVPIQCQDLVRLELPSPHKVEGIALVSTGKGREELLLVTDPDARSSTSLLLSLPWPLASAG